MFNVLGVLTKEHITEGDEDSTVAPHFTHVLPVEKGFLMVAETLANVAVQQNGVVIAAGGAAFTRDVIHRCALKEVNLHLMATLEGASQEKARVLPKRAIYSASQLIFKLYEENPELFSVAIDEPLTKHLYEKSLAQKKRSFPVTQTLASLQPLHEKATFSRTELE
jgi:shikimate kinase